jgi:photosystem II stability/assembly factor-like uncharacterized protein
MGFIGQDVTNGIWMTLNGGALFKTSSNPDLNQIDLEKQFQSCSINTGGYGIIDVNWRTDKEVWAVGGSGVIFVSQDGGKTFKFNDNAKNIPGNLYRLKFFNDKANSGVNSKGFALGSEGVLLRYDV